MDYLTASILSGLLYDGAKHGATFTIDFLKSKLQGWLVDEDTIKKIVAELECAGVDEDLAPHAMERKIGKHAPLMELLREIKPNNEVTRQQSVVGHNVHSTGSSTVSIGNININSDRE
jgi:hypothetical protein